MNILITGGSGFLGKNLGKKLSIKNKIFLGSRNNNLNRIVEEDSALETLPLDVTNLNSVKDVINYTKPDIIIHAAATKYVDISEKNPNECIDINVLGSQNIARVAIDKNIKTVIGISTDKASPPCTNIYGISKSIMERLFCALANQHKTKFVCVRFGNIVWSTGSIFPIWHNMMLKNNIISSTGPEMRRFFFTVHDASDLVISAINNSKSLNGKILIPIMKSAKIKNILEEWCKIYQTKWKKITKRKGDKIDENLVSKSEIKNAFYYKIKNKKYIVLDFKKNNFQQIKNEINSKNSKKLNKNEIKNLILSNKDNV
tara:strand:- start:285 stop:1229 length:945 start_codon:yes stop_codon:yes gene_type:complete